MMLLAKLLYGLSVILFIGNMHWGLYRKMLADKSADKTSIAGAFRKIIRSDLYVTIPSLAGILLLNYYVNSDRVLPGTSLPLSHAVMMVIMYSLIMFIFIIHPLRTSLLRLAEADTFDEERYRKLSLLWVIFGVLELSPPILILLVSFKGLFESYSAAIPLHG